MRDERFDALTKHLGDGTTRRRLLLALVGFASGVPLGRAAAAATPTPTPASAVPPGSYPTPLAERYGACPAGGRGGDPDTNTLKNRIDTVPTDAWLPVTIGAIRALPQPEGTTNYMANWPAPATQEVAPYLGAPVRTEAFAIGAKRSGGETTNCNSDEYGDDDAVDYHLDLAAAGETWDTALVAEVTPRVRVDHPAWTFDALGGMVNEETPVRVSGWLFLDIYHADAVGQTRGTRWELHPVMRIEILRNGDWVDLDGASPRPRPPAEPPEPTTTPVVTTTGECDASYPTVCIPPPPPDLDCSAIPYQSFRVLPPDPHGFDQDGDGIGCAG